ncbi:hypothetical protein C8R43DRAFT_950925 [Mycena crocata]|nr:hypothetical protein C8R43DRAFT_950925 [Mycena crocata]
MTLRYTTCPCPTQPILAIDASHIDAILLDVLAAIVEVDVEFNTDIANHSLPIQLTLLPATQLVEVVFNVNTLCLRPLAPHPIQLGLRHTQLNIADIADAFLHVIEFNSSHNDFDGVPGRRGAFIRFCTSRHAVDPTRCSQFRFKFWKSAEGLIPVIIMMLVGRRPWFKSIFGGPANDVLRDMVFRQPRRVAVVRFCDASESFSNASWMFNNAPPPTSTFECTQTFLVRISSAAISGEGIIVSTSEFTKPPSRSRFHQSEEGGGHAFFSQPIQK